MNVDTQRLIHIFYDLISISAVAKSEKPVADYIRRFLAELDIPVNEDGAGKKVGGNTGNIIAKIHHSEADPVRFAFASHMDTVKPTNGIKPSLRDGRIVTDGNTILGADNRAGIAMILYTIENLKKMSIAHSPFEIFFTIGEETGLYGSTHLDLALLESRQAYILDSSADPGYFVFAAPGAIDFEVELQGKASHAAVNPEQGINAFSMAGDLIRNYPVGRVDEHTTINFGRIMGGEANNVVPPSVSISGEIRSFFPEKIDHHYDRLNFHLSEIRNKFAGDFSLQRQESFPGFVLELDIEPVQRLCAAYKKGQIQPNPIRYYGGSDANVLNNRGIAAIDLGIGAKNPHSVDEYIEVRNMEAIVRLLYHLVTN